MSARPAAGLLGSLLVLLLALAACGSGEAPPQAGLWHCPMHPTYTSDRPGDCPICHMRLVPVDDARGGGARHEPPGVAPAAKGSVPDRVAVEVGEEGLALAGVRTAEAKVERLDREVRTVGEVVPDERLVHHIHTRVSGWVERLHVNFTGQQVRAGAPVLALYSPDLLATQEELLRARELARRISGSTQGEVRAGGETMVDAARRRLRLYDVPDSFIAELERTGKPRRTVSLDAPMSGFVTAKQTFEGQRVEPGMELFTVTDLRRVWIEASVYEYEAPLVRVGDEARITLPHESGAGFQGTVSYVEPTLAAATRTLKVRIELENPDLRLKPGMFANVELTPHAGEGVVVPDAAVIDTGTRRLAFVETGRGRFEPREVEVGARWDGRAEIRSGVVAGERVVVDAAFLIDSESRLRAALAAAGAGAATPQPHAH